MEYLLWDQLVLLSAYKLKTKHTYGSISPGGEFGALNFMPRVKLESPLVSSSVVDNI